MVAQDHQLRSLARLGNLAISPCTSKQLDDTCPQSSHSCAGMISRMSFSIAGVTAISTLGSRPGEDLTLEEVFEDMTIGSAVERRPRCFWPVFLDTRAAKLIVQLFGALSKICSELRDGSGVHEVKYGDESGWKLLAVCRGFPRTLRLALPVDQLLDLRARAHVERRPGQLQRPSDSGLFPDLTAGEPKSGRHQ